MCIFQWKGGLFFLAVVYKQYLGSLKVLERDIYGGIAVFRSTCHNIISHHYFISISSQWEPLMVLRPGAGVIVLECGQINRLVKMNYFFKIPLPYS